MNKNQRQPPESNRLLKCKGSDWTTFTCEGMFIPYKDGKGRRFCVKQKDGTFESDQETWKDIDEWEYADLTPPQEAADETK